MDAAEVVRFADRRSHGLALRLPEFGCNMPIHVMPRVQSASPVRSLAKLSGPFYVDCHKNMTGR